MDWLIEYGYWGLLIASFLAATIIPFSSDVLLATMLFGDFDPMKLWLFATIGNWAGGMVSYYMGHLGKWEWIEKYMRVPHEKVLKYRKYADQYGYWFALITWLPGIGDPIAIALGFARTRLIPTMVLMLIGKGGRYAVIIWAVEHGKILFR